MMMQTFSAYVLSVTERRPRRKEYYVGVVANQGTRPVPARIMRAVADDAQRVMIFILIDIDNHYQ